MWNEFLPMKLLKKVSGASRASFAETLLDYEVGNTMSM